MAIWVDTNNPAFDIVKVVVGAYVWSRIPSLSDNSSRDAVWQSSANKE